MLSSVKRNDAICFLFLSKMHVFSTTVIHVHCSCFVDMVTHCGSWSCSSMDSVCNIIMSWGPEVIGYGYIAQTCTHLQLVKWTYQIHSNNTLSDQSLTCRPCSAIHTRILNLIQECIGSIGCTGCNSTTAAISRGAFRSHLGGIERDSIHRMNNKELQPICG